jgi:hypothetical protein
METAYVNIWNHRAGAVAWDASTRLGTFEFEPSFLKNHWDLAPLQMPLAEARGRTFTFAGHRESKAFRGSLSPAFDVCHSFRPGSTWVNQQSLSINGKRQNITSDDLLSVASQMNIKKAANIVTRINEVVNNWPEYAEETNVNSALRDAISKTIINLSTI